MSGYVHHEHQTHDTTIIELELLNGSVMINQGHGRDWLEPSSFTTTCGKGMVCPPRKTCWAKRWV